MKLKNYDESELSWMTASSLPSKMTCAQRWKREFKGNLSKSLFWMWNDCSNFQGNVFLRTIWAQKYKLSVGTYFGTLLLVFDITESVKIKIVPTLYGQKAGIQVISLIWIATKSNMSPPFLPFMYVVCMLDSWYQSRILVWFPSLFLLGLHLT